MGNGSTETFNFSFIGVSATDLQVIHTNASGIETVLAASQYTLTLNSAAVGSLWGVGGSVTYLYNGLPIAAGTSLTIQRILPLQQLITISGQGSFNPQTIEYAIDTLEMQIQQVSARTGQLRGVWQTGIAYNYGDIVQDGSNGANTGNFYLCAIANTSSVWATDLSSGDWSLALNVQLINNGYLPLTGGVITGGLTINGTAIGPTPNNGDNSTNLATTAFVKNAGVQFASTNLINTATTLTNANAGQFIACTSNSSPITITLPANTTMTDGAVIAFRNRSTGNLIIACNAADAFQFPSYPTSFTLKTGDDLFVEAQNNAQGSNAWYVWGSVCAGRQPGIISAIGCTQGAFKNLKITNGATPNSQVAISADELTLETTDNNYLTARAFSLTASTGTSGANGIDTGSVAASTWYSVWVIYNGTTVAALLSTSSAAPTMPGGYTYKARVGWVRTNASSNLLQTLQLGRKVQYMVGTNPTTMPQMAGGASGSTSTPTYTAIAVGAFVPATAATIRVSLYSGSGLAADAIVAPNGNYGKASGSTNPPVLIADTYSNQGQTSVSGELTLESTNIYYAAIGAAGQILSCLGWEDNI